MSLQDAYYLVSILVGVLGIITLLFIIFILFRFYTLVSKLIEVATVKIEEIQDIVAELGDRGGDLLRLATKDGQQAISTSTILSVIMNAYFFGRTIFGRKNKK